MSPSLLAEEKIKGKIDNYSAFPLYSASFHTLFGGGGKEEDDDFYDDEKSELTNVSDENNDAKTDLVDPLKSDGSLRSPICCIMGHLYSGKTKLLDCIRENADGDVGYVITQQNSATYIPYQNICERTKELKPNEKINVPGLLFIDTPGIQAFDNLRSRGLALCDIAILVVDITMGLHPQTIESLNLLQTWNKKFIVALNQVDRICGWKKYSNAPFLQAYEHQSFAVQKRFYIRLNKIITQFKQHGIDTTIYYQNKEIGETISIVPTSAISGEGIPDMISQLIKWAQKTMVDKLTYRDELQCTVLNVKVEDQRTTIHVILVNGVLHEGDRIVVCGRKGQIVTSIQALSIPPSMKELGAKAHHQRCKEIKGVKAVKIVAQGLEHVIAGTDLYAVKPGDDSKDNIGHDS